MTVRNYELERLVEKRDKTRKEIRDLMRSKSYYTDDSLYEKVRALTGLDTYLSYQIEILEVKIAVVTDNDNSV